MLKLVGPVQLKDLVDGLIEGAKDVDNRRTVSFVISRNLARPAGADAEQVVLDRLFDPAVHHAVRHPNPSPDEVGEDILNMERERNAIDENNSAIASVSPFDFFFLRLVTSLAYSGRAS